MATIGTPNIELCESALEDVLAWGIAQGLIRAACDENEPVTEADVVAIVAQYVGVVEPVPFERVAEPVFVERRKNKSFS